MDEKLEIFIISAEFTAVGYHTHLLMSSMLSEIKSACISLACPKSTCENIKQTLQIDPEKSREKLNMKTMFLIIKITALTLY